MLFRYFIRKEDRSLADEVQNRIQEQIQDQEAAVDQMLDDWPESCTKSLEESLDLSEVETAIRRDFEVVGAGIRRVMDETLSNEELEGADRERKAK